MVNKELVFDAVQGATFSPEEVPAVVQDAFEEGTEGEKLLERIYNARERLTERFDLDFEDQDLMEIITAYDDMVRYIAYQMYDYGAAFARETVCQ